MKKTFAWLVAAASSFAACAATPIADYVFPSSYISEDVTVSTINSTYPGDEIDVYIADGVTVTGDVAFAATQVNFHCPGSFTLFPPAENAAAFDFSNVEGTPAVAYYALPTVSGDVFTATTIPTWVTDASSWTGCVWLKGFAVTDFETNPYGNESSSVRLSGITGWLRAPGNYAYTNSVPLELENGGSSAALTINNGNSVNSSNPNRSTVFKKVSGGGTIDTTSTGDRTVVVIQDGSEFSGSIGLNYGKFIVFGDAMPDSSLLLTNTVGQIYVMEETVVTNSGFWWATGGAVNVDGELAAGSLSNFGGGTSIKTSDTGVFTLTNTSTVDDSATDYARIAGTGTLKYTGSYWRTLSTNNFPTAMTVDNELSAGLILRSPGFTHEIGSLSGSGAIRSDWGGSYSVGDRYLKILQAKDTTYSGLFAETNDRLDAVYVAPGASSAGTLTLSGTQTASNDLAVVSGAIVNLTGVWVGNATVAGTIGGTGTLTGSLALTDGGAFTVGDTPLALSGEVSVSGAVSVVFPDGGFLANGGKAVAIATNVTGLTINDGATVAIVDGDRKLVRATLYLKGSTLYVGKSAFSINLY